MCGRYYIEQEEDIAEMRQILEEVNRRYAGSLALTALRRGEVAPSHVVPVLRAGSSDGQAVVTADLMQWGFPKFQGSGLVINARSETAGEKAMFRQAVSSGRILIPANAFFEWQHPADGSKGLKMKLSLPDEPTFYMAGLARFFADDRQPDLRLHRFVILTAQANASVAAIHDRMPLILPRRVLRSWLFEQERTDEYLRAPVSSMLIASPAA